jgi:threonylcarbamoyladenosine tRNA methylthiotransferase MtaB
MRTFSIQTLGCKVNQYESEQLAAVLRGRGLVQVADPGEADLRVVNTCSVTVQAASKSRQLVRRNIRRRYPLSGTSIVRSYPPKRHV